MSEDSTTQCLLFPGIFRKPVVAQFDQREGSSDGGALLLKAADRHYGLVAGLSSCMGDQRQAGAANNQYMYYAKAQSGVGNWKLPSRGENQPRQTSRSPV